MYHNNIKSPKSGIIIALSDPSSLFLDGKSGYVFSKKTQSWDLCSVLGQSTYFWNSDDQIRQICITPFKQDWYRMAAVLAQVCGQQDLYFSSFKGGITFHTSHYNTTGLPAPGKIGKSRVAPIEGSVLGLGENSEYVGITWLTG